MNIKDLSQEKLAEWFAAHGQPDFRRKQLHDWLYAKYAVSFDEMANLPKTLRDALAQEFSCCSLTALQSLVAEDKTTKWLFQLEDGNTIETVLIKAPDRNTVCISTQVGCQVHCAFCASGKNGLVRNLTASEIIDQVIYVSHHIGRIVSNVVVMGMGEPLHNFQNLTDALETLCAPDGLGLGARHVTVSTSGIPEAIRRLADKEKPWNLAVSLHAVNDRIRAQLIPPKFRSPIKEILKAAAEYRDRTGRMVTLEYILIKGINATPADAEALADIAHDLHAKVNLIPSNSDNPHFTPPPPDECAAFLGALLKRGVQATLRMRKGKDINAACGQLRRRVTEGK